jgi:hypothetical protein
MLGHGATLALVVLALAQSTTEPDAILEAYVRALGGADALLRSHSGRVRKCVLSWLRVDLATHVLLQL